MRNVRIFEADLTGVVPQIYGPLLRAKGISGRAESRIARKIRDELRTVLRDTINRAYIDGKAPMRTGKSRRAMLNGVRAFGTKLTTLRGHIVGPAFLAAHERGSTIRPRNARALTIPIYDGLKDDGSPKLPGPRSWQNVVNTFIYKSKRTGQAYIAYKDSNGSLRILYVLVDQVTLSKYKGFLSTSWDLTKPAIVEAMGEAMLFEMSRVNLMRLARVTTGGRRR